MRWRHVRVRFGLASLVREQKRSSGTLRGHAGIQGAARGFWRAMHEIFKSFALGSRADGSRFVRGTPVPASPSEESHSGLMNATPALERDPGSHCRTEAMAGASSRIPRWKRVLDLGCVAVTLPCWIVLMILITLWIKIVSPGPTFFRQERIGYRGRSFLILKFRSMKVNVETRIHERHLTQLIQENCPMKKLDAAGDSRLIFGGRVLRALGLDEVAQLFNVIRGDMSLVGPRPCTPYEFQHYQPWQRERVNAPPGLTGYWQVNGKNRTTFNEMIRLDLFYARNMSLWLDMKIICKTIPAIMVQALESRGYGRRNGAHAYEQV